MFTNMTITVTNICITDTFVSEEAQQAPSPRSDALIAGADPSSPRVMRQRALKPEIAQQAALQSKVEQVRDRSAEWNTEGYNAIKENAFLDAKQNPLSTFSIDVDTASYSNVRRFLREGATPPAGAIRTEELINYFTYNYPQPTDSAPFSVNLELATAPWDTKRELVRIGIKGKALPPSERVPANLVFLVDVSGSMDEANKLPLLQRSLRALVENLADNDRVAIVVYAGSSGLVLPSTPGTKKHDILAVLDNLSAGGSTHGSEGIKLAYETARKNFLKEGTNRVILCTDGDFNVGVTDQSELQKLIERERASGVFLSVLGFGTGNVKDSTMELLADKGNGNYAYIDSINEGRKVLVEQMGSTLFTIAKDVKIQVEFNPARVAGYRLIGYENRLLAKEDFNDDKKDAGEIGAGHTVTALYEIIPAGQKIPGDPSVDPLKYQKPEPVASDVPDSGELLTVKLRYKQPDGDKSQLIAVPLPAPEQVRAFDQASTDFRFAAAVAAFGMKLRGSPDAGTITWDEILKIARGALGDDPGSYRAEFLTLVESAKKLSPATSNKE
ncbi:MAG: VWA domain-containing protein [Chthoniobacterales bacterium]|nr:VWA domain-containing protein [Chthoniobacterales bacterium]